MAQIVVQHFELDRIPQAVPRATEDAVHEFPPQLTKGGFHPLAHLTEDEAVGRGLVPSNQQHVGLVSQVRRTLWSAIAQVTQGDASVDCLDQGQSGGAVIPIARRQDDIEDAARNMAQEVEFEAKEPPLTGFPKVRSLVAQQAHPAVADRQAERQGFAVEHVQPSCARSVAACSG